MMADPLDQTSSRQSLPHNLEAEQALLGAILANNDVYPEVVEVVNAGSFFEPVHARIFEAIAKMIGGGSLATPVTLKTFFERDKALAEIGGMKYLAKLAASTLGLMHAQALAQEVRNSSDRRKAITECDRLREAMIFAEPGKQVADDIGIAVTNLTSILATGCGRRATLQTVGDAADAAIEAIASRYQGEKVSDAVGTGFTALDDITGGLKRGQMVICAGRPSMGKSAFAISLAVNAARNGRGVGFLSLEMTAVDIAQRMLSDGLGEVDGGQRIAYSKLSQGRVNAEDIEHLATTRNRLANLPFLIDAQPALTVSQVENKARVIASRFERSGSRLDVLIVDHMHLMRGELGKSRVELFTEISGALAALAKKLDCAVLVLAQLNRAVENRDSKVPTLADLRESGSLEQDASQVWLLYRGEYYLRKRLERAPSVAAEADIRAELAQCENILEVHVAKARHGPTGVARIHALLATNSVSDLALNQGVGQ